MNDDSRKGAVFNGWAGEGNWEASAANRESLVF